MKISIVVAFVCFILAILILNANAYWHSILQISIASSTTGKILLVDGASFILQTNATNKICIAGGC